jgi:hypothetical protein
MRILRIALKRPPREVLRRMMQLLVLHIIRSPEVVAIAIRGFERLVGASVSGIQRIKWRTLRKTANGTAD